MSVGLRQSTGCLLAVISADEASLLSPFFALAGGTQAKARIANKIATRCDFFDIRILTPYVLLLRRLDIPVQAICHHPPVIVRGDCLERFWNDAAQVFVIDRKR